MSSIYDINGNVIYTDRTDFSNYVLGSDLIRRPLKSYEVGELTYGQSFLIYGGHYFSTDGSHIAEQDENFNVLKNVTINVGHGNAFQLGSNGVGYVSGWNDNKIYIVDLSTLTVTGTITLPTTGYTTCAVDDVNKLIYIFQRTSYPTTEEHYNFIVYDYENQNTISTKKTLCKFAAMQACDFYMNKIVMSHGFGTSAVPNGYYVFNVNGDITGEYHLSAFSNVEPEGIFIDRETQELYLSLNDKKVFSIYSPLLIEV